MKEIYKKKKKEKIDVKEIKERLIVKIDMEDERVMEEGIVKDKSEEDVG